MQHVNVGCMQDYSAYTGHAGKRGRMKYALLLSPEPSGIKTHDEEESENPNVGSLHAILLSTMRIMWYDSRETSTLPKATGPSLCWSKPGHFGQRKSPSYSFIGQKFAVRVLYTYRLNRAHVSYPSPHQNQNRGAHTAAACLQCESRGAKPSFQCSLYSEVYKVQFKYTAT